jgi:hypothetical protein
MGFALLILTVTPTIAGFLHRLFGPENSAVRALLPRMSISRTGFVKHIPEAM